MNSLLVNGKSIVLKVGWCAQEYFIWFDFARVVLPEETMTVTDDKNVPLTTFQICIDLQEIKTLVGESRTKKKQQKNKKQKKQQQINNKNNKKK